MVRDFVKGVLWGGVVAVAGLAVASQMAPIDGPSEQAGAETPTLPQDAIVAAPESNAPETVAPPLTAAPEAVIAEDRPALAGIDESPPEGAEAPQSLTEGRELPDEPLLRPMIETEAPTPARVVPDMQAPILTPEPPLAGAAPEPTKEREAQDLAEAVLPTPEARPAAEPLADPTTMAEAEPAVREVADAEMEGAAPDVTAPAVEPSDTESSDTQVNAPTAPLVPSAGLADKTVEGVTTGRLPTISSRPAEEKTADPLAPAPPADLPPISRYARSFANPDGKPLFAILLIDPGTPDVPRADLAELPFPVSFVLDPLAPGAAEAAALYRAAGQEVLMLATGIPKGATAADLEQSFAGLQGALPEAVGLIDTAEAIFQDDRGLAAEVVTHLADQGRGLVTFDRGLNAADQVARRESLPAAVIFRSLDDDGEDTPLIRRYLDRAAFKAAQEGEVVVIGTARIATITALMEWAVEGRAASVALAPITAVMTAN